MYEPRKYRELFGGHGLHYWNSVLEETDLQIGASRPLEREARDAVARYREQVKRYARLDPRFIPSLTPLSPLPGAPEIVLQMCHAAQLAGVGPMAAVAGAIAQSVGKDLLGTRRIREVVVENGGDIFMRTRVPRRVVIYAGESPLSQKIAVGILPEDTPMGICTSSGTLGHAISLGRADAAVVLARDAALADAVATAVGNRVQGPESVEEAVSFGVSIESVLGVLAIIGEKMAVTGKVRLESSGHN